MEIYEILLCVCIAVFLTIYIFVEKNNSYRKGFTDGVEHYANTITKVLDHIDHWNEEAKLREKTDMIYHLAGVEIKSESEGKNGTPLSKRVEYGTDGNPYEMSISNRV